jgi:hypothetical protein
MSRERVMDVVGALRDLLAKIFGDENEAAAYAVDPEGYLAGEGIMDYDLGSCNLAEIVETVVVETVAEPERCAAVVESLTECAPLSLPYAPEPVLSDEGPEFAGDPQPPTEAQPTVFPAPDSEAAPDVEVLQQYINYVTVQVYQENTMIVNNMIACCCEPAGDDPATMDPAPLDDLVPLNEDPAPEYPETPVEEYVEPEYPETPVEDYEKPETAVEEPPTDEVYEPPKTPVEEYAAPEYPETPVEDYEEPETAVEEPPTDEGYEPPKTPVEEYVEPEYPETPVEDYEEPETAVEEPPTEMYEETQPPVDEGYEPPKPPAEESGEPEYSETPVEEPPTEMYEETQPPVDEGYGPKPDDEGFGEPNEPRREEPPLTPEEKAAQDKVEAELARIEEARRAAEKAAQEEKEARQYLEEESKDMGFGTGSALKAAVETAPTERQRPAEDTTETETQPVYERGSIFEDDTLERLGNIPVMGFERSMPSDDADDDDLMDD